MNRTSSTHAHKLSEPSRKTALCLATALLALPPSPSAWALQPLPELLAGARQKSPDAREAALATVQKEAEVLAATGRLLPSLSASGTYALNQYEAAMDAGSAGELVIQPKHQVTGTLKLAVPLLDLSGWKSAGAARSLADAARASGEATALQVEQVAAQYYFQLVGAEALLRSYRSTLEAAEQSLALTLSRRDEGTATDLDVARAQVEVDGAKRSLADQELAGLLARRALTTLTGIVPTAGAPDLSDDLNEEAALAQWEEKAGQVPSVAAAGKRREAAERQAGAARLALLPTLSAAATEQASNATGFVGHSASFTATATLAWNLDAASLAQIRVQDAAAALGRAQEDRARQAALDAVHEDWQRVRTGIASSRAARSQAAAARLASEVARDRYQAGAGTQLELIQAQRDLASTESARIQADAELALSRVLLRLATGGL